MLFSFVSLGWKLRLIEEQVLEHILEQIKLATENIISYLEQATADLRTEPREDSHDLSEYAVTVQKVLKVYALKYTKMCLYREESLINSIQKRGSITAFTQPSIDLYFYSVY